MTSEEMPLTKTRRTNRDVTITKGYKSLLREVSTSHDLDSELSKEQSDSRISENLDRAEALFGALSRNSIDSWDQPGCNFYLKAGPSIILQNVHRWC